MELFYSRSIAAGERTLDIEESNHCIRVLRHRTGDIIHIVDGVGTMYECRITDDSPKQLSFEVLEVRENWGSHPYKLHMAVAPPKNIDRFEWFAEKATEIGVDRITPIFGEYSERKVFKKERCERIVVSAAKQSHKGAMPELEEAVGVMEFLKRDFGENVCRLICYCDDTEPLGAVKKPMTECLGDKDEFVVMIGPEGDFSRAEIAFAIERGWQPVSLGDSRLRIETAALTATAAVYLSKI